MNEEELYRQHIKINLPLTIGVFLLSAVVAFSPWHIGILYPVVVGCSLLGLFYSYYKIQYHEIRTIIRIFIAIDLILLAVALPMALS